MISCLLIILSIWSTLPSKIPGWQPTLRSQKIKRALNPLTSTKPVQTESQEGSPSLNFKRSVLGGLGGSLLYVLTSL